MARQHRGRPGEDGVPVCAIAGVKIRSSPGRAWKSKMMRYESIREPGRNPRLRPLHGHPFATKGMRMARGMSKAATRTAQWLGDHITDWPGLAALRVPLARAS